MKKSIILFTLLSTLLLSDSKETTGDNSPIIESKGNVTINYNKKKNIPIINLQFDKEFEITSKSFFNFTEKIREQEIGKIFKLKVDMTTRNNFLNMHKYTKKSKEVLYRRSRNFSLSNTNGFIISPNEDDNGDRVYDLKDEVYFIKFVNNPNECIDRIIEEDSKSKQKEIDVFTLCNGNMITTLIFNGKSDNLLFNFAKEYTSIYGYYKITQKAHYNIEGEIILLKAVSKIEASAERNL